jgi:methionyl-tRNA synthetase
MSRWYITVSIPYVNAAPHVGYALELFQGDALARAHCQAGDEVRFLGGTDDHALKNVIAAEAAGLAPTELVATNGDRFVGLAESLGITFDDFIRTSSDVRHTPGVERLWRRTAERGDFYRNFYEGQYCVGCEQFYAAGDLIDGCCPEHTTATEWVNEENWFFRLSRYVDQIIEAITSGTMTIEPESYRNEALAFLASGVQDISVSRSQRRARGWGIAVPDDPDQVIYVWWDALANYVTALGYGTNDGAFQKWWLDADERVHVIGKGILRFHAVYWPALLLSVGLPLPTRLYVHPYLTVDGAKISKSAGNGPGPAGLIEAYGVDALRWWMCHEVPRHNDADFSVERLIARANEDLANGLGNLASRVATMIIRFRGGIVPGAPGPLDAEQAQLQQRAAALEQAVIQRIDAFDFRAAALSITDVVGRLNRYIEHSRPWQLARAEKSQPPADPHELDQVLGLLARAVGQVAEAATPLIPEGVERLRQQIGGSGVDVPPTFPRLEVEAPKST